jgi:hypothetical protein
MGFEAVPNIQEAPNILYWDLRVNVHAEPGWKEGF